ncbi:MAG: tRNA (guanosine(37)-N1)-methyltransferase TrmD [Desulfofustis sp. PB-SRB1]|jgi:tRNA (guanine37-N1)-methyltransferase|nr:tRNA (guanosine(37)-N1)-methyltransferase TrmD [Desulfofustis sp. PB-SRB1]MBM1003875.1 tRNA (guanosine(37)-N1)-methyltransferase TrmD [Desulfofustis sp. PB-SRB1]HBH29160.1 tRNA (guanosine(37)-N1)-methyltransferase TrmD [Desulfofustis sp.]
MRFSILSIFPHLLDSPLQESIIGRARSDGHVVIDILDIRTFTDDAQHTTDDRPYGGGEGMVMKPEPLARAVAHARTGDESPARVILLSPQGHLFTQGLARQLSQEKHLILVCGRYEGVDERFRSDCVDDEISIGDYVLTGGELPAMVVIDTITRLLPGVLGCPQSAEQDTFSRGLLKHPQYTRPRSFNGHPVPPELLGGNHREIESYRFLTAVRRTLERRPDLLATARFTSDEKRLLARHGLADKVAALAGTDRL